ncbi:MAG: hypothetical protein ACREQE_06255 [Candidatus Binataceae bacterium]
MKATTCVLAALLALTASGCAKLAGYWPRQWNSSAAQESYFEFRTPETSACKTATRHRRKRTRHARREVRHLRRAAAPAIPVTSTNFQPVQALPQTSPTVTLAGEEDRGAPARHSLDETALQLARVDRARLSGVNLSTYEEVGGFLRAGRDALARRDYLAAAGFAQKASSLASSLPIAASR